MKLVEFDMVEPLAEKYQHLTALQSLCLAVRRIFPSYVRIAAFSRRVKRVSPAERVKCKYWNS